MYRWILVLVCMIACAPQVSEKLRVQARIHYDLGITSFTQGDMRAALRELLLSIQDDPYFAQAHHALGLVYHALQKRDEALMHYKKAIALNPKFSEAYNNMGTLQLDLGKYQDAIKSFQKALSDLLYSTPYLAEGNLGYAYYKSGNKELGKEHLKTAVNSVKQFCRGYIWLAEIYLSENNAQKALEQCQLFSRYCVQDEKIAETVPRQFIEQVQYFAGMSFLKQGNKKAARQAFNRCATQESDAKGYALECNQALQTLR